MQTIKLTKMNGCGNDFVIITEDEFRKANMPISEFAKKVCDRNFGVGADGLIIPKESTEADIAWDFYNSDGSVAQMCGNGMRCFAKYVTDNKLVDKKQFSVKTLRGVIIPEILDNGLIRVNMGEPILQPEKIPFKGKDALNATIKTGSETFKATAVSMGNPHCVIITDNNPHHMAEMFGPALEQHELFPEKTNVEFVKIVSKNEIEMRVYERGCGITLACGTGSCASVVACVLNNLTENKVKVNLLGGDVTVEWQGIQGDKINDVFITGGCSYNFFAEYVL